MLRLLDYRYLADERLLPVARMNTPVRRAAPGQPIAREIGAADRSRWARIRNATLHAYMQRFLGIGALRCHARRILRNEARLEIKGDD